MELFQIILVMLFSYLVGSIPTALIVSKYIFGFDIREKGSGNMGSTNAFRFLGWKWGVVVQLLDILKGIFAVVLVVGIFGSGVEFSSITYFEDVTVMRYIAGISAVLGHMFTIFAGFRGGKGINTALGMLLGIAPVDVAVSVGIFLIALLSSGYVSLGSITAAIAFPSSIFIRYNIFDTYIPGYHIIIIFSLVISILLILAHRKNLIRLLKGTENRFSKLHIFKLKKKPAN